MAAIAAALLTAACGGGGGGGIAPATSITGNSPSAGSGGTSGSGGGTGGGTSTANCGAALLCGPYIGPTFDGTGGSYPSNVSFALLSSSLQYTSAGPSAVMNNQSGTATVISEAMDSSTVRLVVPSVNLDQTLTLSTSLAPLAPQPALPTPGGWDQSSIASRPNQDYISVLGFSYVSLGVWLHSGSKDSTPQITFTAYAFGYETPAAAMPTTGSATYGGSVLGGLSLSPPAGLDASSCVDCNSWLTGVARFSVDFASSKISGAFTNMMNHGASGVLPWNDVSVNASILAGTNKLSGSTAISAPLSPAVGGTGRIDGAFYGPNANNLGAIWSLRGANWTALGGVAASAISPWDY